MGTTTPLDPSGQSDMTIDMNIHHDLRGQMSSPMDSKGSHTFAHEMFHGLDALAGMTFGEMEVHGHTPDNRTGEAGQFADQVIGEAPDMDESEARDIFLNNMIP